LSVEIVNILCGSSDAEIEATLSLPGLLQNCVDKDGVMDVSIALLLLCGKAAFRVKDENSVAVLSQSLLSVCLSVRDSICR
jgi:hypothetical protein